MTLLISPDVEFLDELTTNVDPCAKRGLYKQFYSMKEMNQSSTLFMTSSVKEAAQVCDRIAILVNGQIVCYGSPEYLMQSYCGGCEITAIVDIMRSDYLDAYREIQESLPNATSMVFQGYAPGDSQKWQMIFKVTQTVALSKVFEVMSRLVNNDFIESFTATKASLEEVYKQFARFQQVVDKREKTMVNPVGRFAAINNSAYSDTSMRPSNVSAYTTS